MDSKSEVQEKGAKKVGLEVVGSQSFVGVKSADCFSFDTSPWGPESGFDHVPSDAYSFSPKGIRSPKQHPWPLTSKWKLLSLILFYSGRKTASLFHLPAGLHWLESQIYSLKNFWYFFPLLLWSCILPTFFPYSISKRREKILLRLLGFLWFFH